MNTLGQTVLENHKGFGDQLVIRARRNTVDKWESIYEMIDGWLERTVEDGQNGCRFLDCA